MTRSTPDPPPGWRAGARGRAARMALTDPGPGVADGGPDVVCTLEGGLGAVQDRVGQWQAVIGRALSREAADGGVTLVYPHDPDLAAELARLSAAESACCSFFTFTLTVTPDGMRLTVTAPPQADDVLTAVFGAHPGGTVDGTVGGGR